MQPFDVWLRRRVDQRGWNLSEFARACGVRPGTAQRWLRGERIPDPMFCQRIAGALGLDDALVLYHAGHLKELPAAPEVYEAQSNIRYIRDQLDIMEGSVRPDEIMIRFRGRVPADVRRWAEAEDGGEPVRVSRRIVGARDPRLLFAVQVSGDCLTPQGILNGDIVFCERIDGVRVPRNGEVAVVRLESQVTMKVWYQEGNQITLRDGYGDVAHQFSVMDEFVVEGVYIGGLERPASS